MKPVTHIQIKPLVHEVNELLRTKSEPDYLEKIRRLVPTENPIIGVRVPVIKELVKQFRQNRDVDFEMAFNLLDAFFERQIRDEILFGIFVLKKYKTFLSTDHFETIDRWVDKIENWEVCDQLAMNIAAIVVMNDLTLVDNLIDWTQSTNFWRRRFTLAVTTAFNHEGRSHVSETLRICEKLMTDKEMMVQKAVGWALREACKKDEKQVFRFLMSWKMNAPPRLIKESSEKLSPELRKQLLNT